MASGAGRISGESASPPKCIRKVVFFGLAVGGAATALILVAGATNGRLFDDGWLIWSLPAWLFPALGAWSVFSGKGDCGEKPEDKAAAESAGRAPAKLRGEARREQRREARRQRRERRSARRKS